MVRVANVFGDVKKGRQGNAVYQNFYGKQVRRLWTKKKKNDSSKQLEVQGRFKEGVDFASTLSRVEIGFLKSYVAFKGLKLTWHNFAKLIVMAPVEVDLRGLEKREAGPGEAVFPDSMGGWSFRNRIDIVENSGISWTGYQLPLLFQGNDPGGIFYIDFSKIKSGGDDIRFTWGDGFTFLDYFIESWDALAQTAKIWVRVDSLPGSQTTPIYVYYQNPDALPVSDPLKVFYAYDPASGLISSSFVSQVFDILPSSIIAAISSSFVSEVFDIPQSSIVAAILSSPNVSVLDTLPSSNVVAVLSSVNVSALDTLPSSNVASISSSFALTVT